MNHRAVAIETYRRLVDRAGRVQGSGKLKGSRLRLVSGLEMMSLSIPASSARGPVFVNLDCALIDQRAYKKAKRKAQR